jgi:membrane peptidoglycan carboxypeptidase
MNPYGDSTNSAHGRARIPGSDGGYDGYAEGGHQQHDAYDPYHEPAAYQAPPPVPASYPVTGRASVPGAPVSPAHGAVSGVAAVPGAAAGRATVGRASVRPPDVITGPGGGGPGGPDGPGTPGGPKGPGRAGSGKGGKGGKGGPQRKRAMRRNIILSSFALLIMLSGLLVVGGTYYFDNVKMPDQLPVPNQSTTIYYADGKTPMAKIGNENRTIVSLDQIPENLRHAVVAAEDSTFYHNSGVDFRGVMRAAWNNFTGGNRQGASTITQQYARNMADLEGITYARKLREAVIAMKLSQKYSKDQILWAYLNSVYFGRGTYGVEAAAQAYFKKDAQQLTVEEDMLLAALIKQPEPNPTDGTKGYDPANSPENATDRWGYVKDQMVKGDFLKKDAADKMKYPTTWVKPGDSGAAEFGKDTPAGFVVHQVMSELTHNTGGKFTAQNLKSGGFKIITTVRKDYEDAAISIADDTVKGSVMNTQPANLQASLVAIEPGTGRVLAYYGGHNGSGGDYAGIWSDPVLDTGDWSGYNHNPGSTFKIYTLATALSKGIGIDSYWDGPESKEFPDADRTKAKPAGPVTNLGESCAQATGTTSCTLQQALALSLNTVYFAVGKTVGPANVIDMAKAMGIRHIWDLDNKRWDLTQYAGKDLFGPHIGYNVSIGGFGITTLDNADGVATVAARGVQADAHFVVEVDQGAKVVWREVIKQNKITETTGISQQALDDEAWAMQTVNQTGLAKNHLANNRPVGAKTGTWELHNTKDNSQAWYVGFTPGQLAVAVNISSRDPKNLAIRYANGKTTSVMNGTNTPGDIWKKFMDKVLAGQPVKQMPPAKHVGDTTAGNAQSPQPSAPADQGGQGGGGNGGGFNPCQIPALCATPTPTKGVHG